MEAVILTHSYQIEYNLISSREKCSTEMEANLLFLHIYLQIIQMDLSLACRTMRGGCKALAVGLSINCQPRSIPCFSGIAGLLSRMLPKTCSNLIVLIVKSWLANLLVHCLLGMLLWGVTYLTGSQDMDCMQEKMLRRTNTITCIAAGSCL